MREDMREAIRDELAGWPLGSGYYSITVDTGAAGEMADALLPIVRRAVAEALREAAQEQRNEAENVPWDDEGTHADGHRCAATFLDRRADRVDR